MHEYIRTNINKEIWVVMEILVQMSIRCILSGEGCGLWHIFDKMGQPCVTICDRREEGVKVGPEKCDIFLNGPIAFD